VLAFSELHKEFKLGIRLKRVHAVRGVSLDVKRGEIFGYLGPNGAGKTTTMKMAMGLIQATRGEIRLFGRPHTEHGLRQRVGFLPENPYFYGYLTPVELLDYYGRLFGMAKAHRRKRTEELLDLVGLTEARNRPLRGFSKGMVQRAGVAQALINDPDLLILDEPTSGLDPLGTRQFKDLIRTLAARGKTVLLSSHLLADVEDVCDRVCILYGGRERATGTLDELLARREQTQLVTDELDEATLDELRRMLASRGRELRDVSWPRDRLENLFLRIVDEARQQRVTTGGAIAGGRVADFLTGQEIAEGRDIIESLVAKPETEAPVEAPEQAPAKKREEAVDESVLVTLMDDKPEPAETKIEPADTERSEKTPADQTQADRNVIDDLLEGKD
jgi:ABC-2 type transport system ATP-binding protein